MLNNRILANPWNWLIIILTIVFWYYGIFSAISKRLAFIPTPPAPSPTPTPTPVPAPVAH